MDGPLVWMDVGTGGDEHVLVDIILGAEVRDSACRDGTPAKSLDHVNHSMCPFRIRDI